MATARRRSSSEPRAGTAGAGMARSGAGPVRAAVRSQVADIQRSRLLAAAVAALEEQGYENTSVAHITGRSRVSRRTFYDLFANREECIAAVLQDAAAQVARELAEQGVPGLAWRERMRAGLWTVLCFLEREPALGRTLVVQSAHGSGPVAQARAAIVDELVAAVDAGRRECPRASHCTALTAEGVVGAVLAILHTRLASSSGLPVGGRGARAGRAPDGGRSLRTRPTGLLGELTAIVLLPYEGAAVARREQAKPAPARPVQTAQPALLGAPDPLAGLSMRITYRTARVLEGIAAHPGMSNREAARHAGIADQGQVSKLLARLRKLGLVDNGAHIKGAANAWALTPMGLQVARSLGGRAGSETGPRSGDE